MIRTNLQFIPVESSCELQVADKLIAERRPFSKPLKLDGELRYLPDFLLHDCKEPWVMEVFGMTNDGKYQTHTLETVLPGQVHFCWQLSPEVNGQMPLFPR
ncbi:DUF1173 family protein [Methylomonas sp. MO1]|uniref:DUF1173 family protein n=1 Tax=Methylomonas sp. MO1 TaxID=3073619 RepID=UPI0028A38ADA|nr:DUF1173 family protein [Methylomonas sp. MO1]MDT4292353.1 DUF1173 family protein [Methylomonas sp. MO1]